MRCRIVCAVFCAASALAAASGSAIYSSKCATCHGSDGKGRTSVAKSNLRTTEARKRSDRELREAIGEGGPSRNTDHFYRRKGLSAADVEAVAAYVRQLQR